jgi:hypothetical protein
MPIYTFELQDGERVTKSRLPASTRRSITCCRPFA